MYKYNLALEFETKADKINNKLDDVEAVFSKEIVKSYRDRLKLVRSKYDINNQTTKFGSYNAAVETSLLSTYTEGLKELDDIEKIIDIYLDYCQINFDLLKINNELNNQIDISKIDQYIDMIIHYLEILRVSRIQNHKEVSFIIDMLYDTVYKIMKEEILIRDRTRLYDYVSRYDIDKDKIINLIDKELDNINDSKKNNIGKKLVEYRQSRILTNLYNKELLKLLALYSRTNNQKQMLDSMGYMLQELNKDILKYNDTFNEINEIMEKVDSYKEKLNKWRKELNKRIVSLGLATVLFVPGLAYTIDKSKNKKGLTTSTTQYEITTDSYNSYQDDVQSDKEILELCEYDIGDVIVKIYFPVEGSSRKVVSYKLSDLGNVDLKDYVYKINSYNGGNKIAEENISIDEMDFITDSYYYEVNKINDISEIVDYLELTDKEISKRVLLSVIAYTLTFSILSIFILKRNNIKYSDKREYMLLIEEFHKKAIEMLNSNKLLLNKILQSLKEFEQMRKTYIDIYGEIKDYKILMSYSDLLQKIKGNQFDNLQKVDFNNDNDINNKKILIKSLYK